MTHDFVVAVPLGKEPGARAKGWWEIGKAWKSKTAGKEHIKIRLNAHPIGEEIYLFKPGELP